MGIRSSVAVAALLLAAAAPGAAASAADDPVAAMRGGKGLFEKTCKFCHGLDRSLALVREAQDWATIVKRMVAYGAPLNAEQRALVVRYLAANSALAGRCGGCHELTRVVSDAPGRRDWSAITGRMAAHARELEKRGGPAAGGSFSVEQLGDIAALLQVVIP